MAAVLAVTSQASAQSIGCTTGGLGGIIPTSGTGGGGVYPTTLPANAFSSTLNVASIPPGATAVTEVKLFGLTHTWSADVQFVLTTPSGVSHNLWNTVGGACDLGGDYVVVAPQFPALPFPTCTATTIAPGTYEQNFNSWPSGTNNIFNTSLSAITPATGNWTLTAYDWAGGDIGALTSWDICFGTPPPPPPPPPSACNGPALTTLFASNNNGGVGGQIFFDINVTNPSGILLSQIDINTTSVLGTAFTMDVYTTPTTYVGNNGNSAVWTLISSGAGTSAGNNVATLVDVTDVVIPPGSRGVSLILNGINHAYTNGTGANQIYSNTDLTLSAGAAQNAPWNNIIFTPRVFNGAIRYNCGPLVPPIVTYCTGGTTTNGCTADIAATNQPSLTAAAPCVINVTDVEGQKSGLIFYSINGQQAQGWNASSFLCVKAPTQRTTTQSSGGTVASCTGSLSLNWDAFQAANPTALGQPWAVGNKAQLQAWFRDPPAGKSTNLSNAIELTYVP
ncbi:MAG: proprotein convertase P-domain-containing protein [Planctomycetota bacterium]|nr:proprotein convertase P-domain-containing protein [Planctomycetota bacterium]